MVARQTATSTGSTWAVVLAGGEGSRLRGMTVDEVGRHVPKQFCRIDGQRTLLELALRRAGLLVEPDHVMVSVADSHERWWGPQLSRLPAANIISQPANRGTAFGILLPLLLILRRDPSADVVFVPADHFVSDEEELGAALRSAMSVSRTDPDSIALIGVEPDRPEGDYGYILPGRKIPATGAPSHRVREFVEKPGAGAPHLLEQGALWNTFIFAASGRGLLRMFLRRMGNRTSVLQATIEASAGDPRQLARLLAPLYDTLPIIDFSRDVLADAEDRLAVVRARNCGWSDLGNPRRVLAWMEEHRSVRDATSSAVAGRFRSEAPAVYEDRSGSRSGSGSPATAMA